MPISITYNLTAANCPTPLQPAPSVIGQPSQPIQQGSSATWIPILNQLVSMLGALASGGGGGYAVMSGCVPVQTTGLNVSIGAGLILGSWVNGYGPLVELLNSGTPVVGGFQQLTPAAYTLPDNSTSYLWTTQDPSTGAIGLASTTSLGSPPTHALLFVGNITTLSGAVTAIDQSGVVKVTGGQLTRQTADTSTPGDAPPAGMRLLTVTPALNYQWDGSAHKALVDLTKQLPGSVNKQTITTALTLTETSANNQYITASGGNQRVILPDPTTLPLGWSIAIFNAGGSNNVLVYEHTNTTQICPLTPGQAISFGTLVVSGAVAFPGGSYTPGTPTAGVPAGPV